MTREKCPDCDAIVAVPEDAVQGEVVTCPDCGLDLEVSLNGGDHTVKAVAIEKEDWGE